MGFSAYLARKLRRCRVVVDVDNLKIQGCKGRWRWPWRCHILGARVMLMMLVTHFRPGSSFRFRAEVQGSRQPLHSAKTFHLLKRHSNFQTTTFLAAIQRSFYLSHPFERSGYPCLWVTLSSHTYKSSRDQEAVFSPTKPSEKIGKFQTLAISISNMGVSQRLARNLA